VYVHTGFTYTRASRNAGEDLLRHGGQRADPLRDQDLQQVATQAAAHGELYMYRNIHIYMCVYIYIYLSIYLSKYRYMCVYIFIYDPLRDQDIQQIATQAAEHGELYMYRNIHIYMCVYIYIYIYLSIHLNKYRYICVYISIYDPLRDQDLQQVATQAAAHGELYIDVYI